MCDLACVSTFTVMLAKTLHGCTVGSTKDVFDADTAADAQALAVTAWKAVEPRYGFQPLLVIERA
jgi:hypothetical protein